MIKLRLIEIGTDKVQDIELTRVPTIKEKIKIDDVFTFEVTDVLHLTSSSFDAELTVKKSGVNLNQIPGPKFRR